MNKAPVLLAGLLAGGMAVAALAQTEGGVAASKNRVTTALVTLNAVNNSGENGTATLTPVAGSPGRTRVVVRVQHEFATANQPAHIHNGTCATLDPNPHWALNNVRHGQSVTIVPVSLATILKTPHAINVHKSARAITQYIACGDVKAGTVSTTTTRHGASQ